MPYCENLAQPRLTKKHDGDTLAFEYERNVSSSCIRQLGLRVIYLQRPGLQE